MTGNHFITDFSVTFGSEYYIEMFSNDNISMNLHFSQ